MEQLHPDSDKLIQEATDDKTSPDRLNELAKIGPTLTRLVAANPNANPDLLAELASREDKEIRRTVAANPNAPTEVLWKLGEEFPDEVLDNAVFSLLLLENPNLIETVPEYTFVSFLMCSTVPVSFIELAINLSYGAALSQEMELALTLHLTTSQTILEKLVESENILVPETVRLHENYSGEIQDDWEQALRAAMRSMTLIHREHGWFEEPFEDCFFTLAGMGWVPKFFWEALAKHEDERMRAVVASIFYTPVCLLEQLAEDEDYEVPENVSWNRSTPIYLLEQLAQHEDYEVRQIVAFNRNTPASILDRLARDEYKGTRWGVAYNPNTPVQVLEELAQDKYFYEPLAGNPNTPVNILEKLGEHKDVWKSLASNPNAPVCLLEHLASDNNVAVCRCVAKNPNTPLHLLEQLEKSKSDDVDEYLACNPNIPVFLLEKLALSTRVDIRQNVASNPNTSINLLEQLAKDEYSSVRGRVAARPNTPFHLLERVLWSLELEDIHEEALLRYLAKKPDELPRVLEHYAKIEPDPDDYLETYYLSRAVVLWHPQMPAKVLAQNCRSLAWLERCAIAQNPNTPTDALQILAKDGNRIVRAAARDNLSDARVMV